MTDSNLKTKIHARWYLTTPKKDSCKVQGRKKDYEERGVKNKPEPIWECAWLILLIEESVESTPHVLQLQWVWRGSAMKKMQDSDAPLYPEEEGYGGLGIKRVNMHCHVMFS